MDEEFQFDNSPLGSVGSLVSAALETAGHSMQSSILDFFQLGFANDFAALLYLMAAIGGIFVIAVGGKYKFGLWFLLGPVLFFFLITPRVPSKGVSWSLGGRNFDQIYVDLATEGVSEKKIQIFRNEAGEIIRDTRDEGANKVGDVSWFFVSWDYFVSGFVRGFSSMLNLEASNADLSLLNKVQRYHTLMTLEVENPALKGFISLVMVSECNRYFGLMKDLYAANVRINSSEEVREMFQRTIVDEEGRKVVISSTDKALVEASRAGVLIDEKGNVITEERLREKQGYSCEDIWKLGINSITHNAESLFGAVAAANATEGMSIEDVKRQISAKVNTQYEHPDGRISKLDDNQRLLAFINEMALRIFFRELQKIHGNVNQIRSSPHGLQQPTNEEHQAAVDIREAYQGLEYEGKGIYLSLALALPYVQGLALYVLALSYPLFAMAVVFPGRHGAFFRWMALWFWIKSWDIGFAVVMLMDNLLYNLLPHGPPVIPEILDDPAEAIKTILEVDPAYGVNVYFNLLATLIAAVPVATGILVKRGGGEILHTVAEGFHDFSGKIGFAMMQAHTALRNYDLSEQVTRSENITVIEATRGGLLNAMKDPTVASALGAEFVRSYANNVASAKRDEIEGLRDNFLESLRGVAHSQEASRYLQQIAFTKIEQNVMRAAYEESQSSLHFHRVGRAIINYYSNHDWIIGHPAGAEISHEMSKRDFRPGGPIRDAQLGFAFREISRIRKAQEGMQER
jgi:hypothetical protein